MTAIDFLSHIRSESARFASVLGSADPDARVPSCPEWTAADLLWHLAEVQFFWGTIVHDRLDDPDPAEAVKPARPSTYDGLLAFFDSSSQLLISALESCADDVAVWTWSSDHTAGFVRRRQAHEALIHRLDAELAVGAVTDFDAALAEDGALEALQFMYGGWPEWADYTPGSVVGQVRTTDTGAAWTVRLGAFSGLSPNTGNNYEDEAVLELIDSGSPSFTIAASARDLDAWLWNRPLVGPFVLDGDLADYESFAAIVAKGVD